jgi:glycerol-3-phosphate acyltransferase PlsY
MLNLIFLIMISYLVGSIPTSIIISKLLRGIDIRNHGSGNAGGTNVFRVMGWKWGVATILLDACKGAIVVIVVARFYLDRFPFPNATPFDDFTLVQIICGVAAVIGHIWTVFAGFRGGKGIATALGVLITIITLDMIVALGVFVIVVTFSRYISLGSLMAAISVPLILIVRENILLVIFTHRANVERLLSGTEKKISLAKKNSHK